MVKLSDKLFGNVVAILKTFSVIVSILGLIGFICFFLIEVTNDYYGEMFLFGLLFLVGGYTLAISNYALAKLIENTEKNKTE